MIYSTSGTASASNLSRYGHQATWKCLAALTDMILGLLCKAVTMLLGRREGLVLVWKSTRVRSMGEPGYASNRNEGQDWKLMAVGVFILVLRLGREVE